MLCFSQNCIGPSKTQEEEKSPDARSKFLLWSYMNSFLWYSLSLILLLLEINSDDPTPPNKMWKTDYIHPENPDDLRTLNEMIFGTLFFGLTTLFLLLSKQFSNIDRSKFEIHKQILKECQAFRDAKDVEHSEFVSYLSSQKFVNKVETEIFDILFNASLKSLTHLEFVSYLSSQKFENEEEKHIFDALFESNIGNFEKLRNADGDMINSTGLKETLLTKAAQIKEGTHYLEILLSNKDIDVNKVDVTQIPYRSPLSCAIVAENMEATKMLLARADINVNKGDAETDEIRTPLVLAVQTCNP